MYAENHTSNSRNNNGEDPSPVINLYSKADLVIHDLENLKREDDFEKLLDGQAKLKKPLAHFSREDVETLTSYCIRSLKEAVESDKPEMAIAFAGYLGTVRDFSPSYGKEAKAFWDDTVDTLLSIDQQLEEKLQSSPDIWERVVPLIRPGIAWMQLPFGASEDLSEASVHVKLYDCYLNISMSKLHDYIDGEGCVRMAHEHCNEPHPLLKEYDSATSVIEKTSAAVRDLERTFETDFPGQLKVIGPIEEVSDDIGRVKIQCSTRARYILKMCWIVEGVQEINKPWYKFW